jgi:pantetheine-phosphate adenylyltransferase
MNDMFKMVIVGGTFDELHKGHKALLRKAFQVGKKVLIGLSSDKLADKIKKNHKIASYSQRLKELKDFLGEHGFLERVKIVPLDNPYGVTLTTTVAQAIVVSQETELRTFAINEKRRASGLPPLEVVVIDMIPAENHIPISTTRIRHGEIDREGRLLKSNFYVLKCPMVKLEK